MTHPRRRNRQLTCEVLETRQLLSADYIANMSSGNVLDDPAFATNNAKITEYQLNGGSNQQWSFVGVGGGKFAILNESR